MLKKEELKAFRQGELKLANVIISCAVLTNKQRVISIRSFANALGVKGGGAYWKLKRQSANPDILPEFISAQYLQEYLGDEVPQMMSNTISYIALNGQEAVGIEATIIPRICDVWIRALAGGKLTDKQKEVAEKAHKFLSALADKGIIALIDQATGFQRDIDDYNQIVEKYVAKELQPYIKTFGQDFYFQIYRLKGWDWNRFAVDKKNHPWAVANITNRVIYEKLPPGILAKLDEMNPPNEKGVRDHRKFQDLTPNFGYVHLLKHMGAVVNILEGHEDGQWVKALQQIDTRFPSLHDPYQLLLDFNKTNKNVFEETVKIASLPSPDVNQKQK